MVAFMLYACVFVSVSFDYVSVGRELSSFVTGK
jgi:hypothetical protein